MIKTYEPETKREIEQVIDVFKVFRDDGYNITICPEVLATLEQYRSLFEA